MFRYAYVDAHFYPFVVKNVYYSMLDYVLYCNMLGNISLLILACLIKVTVSALLSNTLRPETQDLSNLSLNVSFTHLYYQKVMSVLNCFCITAYALDTTAAQMSLQILIKCQNGPGSLIL